MDEMEFTEAESNLNDLVAEYQTYEVNTKYGFLRPYSKLRICLYFTFSICHILVTYYFQDADIEDEAEAFEEDEEIFGSSSQSEKIQQ